MFCVVHMLEDGFWGYVKGLIAPSVGSRGVEEAPNFNLKEGGGKKCLSCKESCRMTAGGSFK